MKAELTVHRIRTHPGDILRHELEARGVSANQLALALGVPSGRIVEILNRKRGISADTALRLARYLGTSAQFWMNLQGQYDLSVAQQEVGRMIEARVQPADSAAKPVRSRSPRIKAPTSKGRRAAS
jgi:addiction module HigA family antidote